MINRSLARIAVLFSLAGVVGVGIVSCGDKPAPSPPTPKKAETENKTVTATSVTPTNTADIASHEKGKALYAQSCHVCHDTGTLNAPRLGDKSAWEARIAQGKETLYAHAINGFTGKTGTMPPKGGSNAPDSEVKSAVDYMLSKAQ